MLRYQTATAEHMTGIFAVRTAVRENHLSMAALADQGITPDALTQSLTSGTLGGWVAVECATVAGFSMADAQSAEIFGLFVHPNYQGCGIGSRLLDLASCWLLSLGHRRAHLYTGAATSAVTFYQRKGWRSTGPHPQHHDEIGFERCLYPSA